MCMSHSPGGSTIHVIVVVASAWKYRPAGLYSFTSHPEGTGSIAMNVFVYVCLSVCGADARQPATKTASVRPADSWHQTGKWTKTALQGHHQAQHKSLQDYHRYLGASGNGAI